jgi:hypothetical protein
VLCLLASAGPLCAAVRSLAGSAGGLLAGSAGGG